MSPQDQILLFCMGLFFGCMATILIAGLAISFYKAEVKA
jgi:hypothetical protein